MEDIYMNDSAGNLFIFIVFSLVIGLCVLILASLWKFKTESLFCNCKQLTKL